MKMKWIKYVLVEAVTRRCSVKKVFLEISKNLQENTCVRVSFLIKLQASGLKFPRTPFPTEHLRWLLLCWSGYDQAVGLVIFPPRCLRYIKITRYKQKLGVSNNNNIG